jgi:hypothetical protein
VEALGSHLGTPFKLDVKEKKERDTATDQISDSAPVTSPPRVQTETCKMSTSCAHLTEIAHLQPPKLSQSVHREECTQCFDDQV